MNVSGAQTEKSREMHPISLLRYSAIRFMYDTWPNLNNVEKTPGTIRTSHAKYLIIRMSPKISCRTSIRFSVHTILRFLFVVSSVGGLIRENEIPPQAEEDFGYFPLDRRHENTEPKPEHSPVSQLYINKAKQTSIWIGAVHEM